MRLDDKTTELHAHYEGKVFLFHRELCYDVVPLWDGHFVGGGWGGGGGRHLGFIETFLTCGPGIPNRNHNL